MDNNKQLQKLQFKCVVCCKVKRFKGTHPEDNTQPKFTLDVLQTVYPDTKLVLSDIPTICGCCEGILNKAFDFKSCCLDINDHLKNFMTTDNKIDMKEVYFHVYEISCKDSEKQDLCRLCLESVEDISYITNEDGQLQVMLGICLPELKLSSVDKFSVCSICTEHLQKQYNFIKKLAKLEGSVSVNKNYMEPGRRYINLDDRRPETKRRRVSDHQCSHCRYSSKEEKCLQLHVLLTHLDVNSVISERISNGSKTYICKECPFETVRDYIMWSHVLLHEHVFYPLLKCPECEFETKDNAVMAKHKAEHTTRNKTRKQLYQCTLCSFKEYKNPNSHFKNHVTRNARILECDTCRFKTNNRKHLKLHMWSHERNEEVDNVPNDLKCIFCEFESTETEAFLAHCDLCVKTMPSERFYVSLRSGKKREASAE